MVKHNRKGLIYGQAIVANPLGTLTDGDVISAALTQVVNDTRLGIYLKATHTMRGLTAGQGPIEVGVAHSDYSAAEIEECLESLGNWDLGDKVAQEQSNRKVRRIGEFSGEAAVETLNDGKPIYTKLNWKLAEGDTIQYWARNASGVQLTTGASPTMKGKFVMKPIP